MFNQLIPNPFQRLVTQLSGNKELLAQVKKQIEKDLGIEFRDEINSWFDLHGLTKAELDCLIASAPSTIPQLLYRIDIPEKQVRNCLQLANDTSSELAKLILQRELLKVLFRWKYSGKLEN